MLVRVTRKSNPEFYITPINQRVLKLLSVQTHQGPFINGVHVNLICEPPLTQGGWVLGKWSVSPVFIIQTMSSHEEQRRTFLHWEHLTGSGSGQIRTRLPSLSHVPWCRKNSVAPRMSDPTHRQGWVFLLHLQLWIRNRHGWIICRRLKWLCIKKIGVLSFRKLAEEGQNFSFYFFWDDF